MDFETFSSDMKLAFTNYFNDIQEIHRRGGIGLKGRKMLYPTILLFLNCGEHYAVEVVGASEVFSGFSIKLVKCNNIYKYISQFDGNCDYPLWITNNRMTLNGLCLSRVSDLENAIKRFPALEIFKNRSATLVDSSSSNGSMIKFEKDFVGALFDDCFLVNKLDAVVRCKNILLLFVVRSNLKRHVFRNYIEREMAFKNDRGIKGVHLVSEENEKILLTASQLQNLYLSPGVHETTIGHLIENYPDLIYRSFATDNFLYEKSFKWVEHDGTCEDNFIRPDLLLRRADGYYDICDLKTALLDKKSITKGKRKRRRFFDFINDGIHQLANYEEYFTYEKNAAFARDKYGVEINNPNLILVVGTWENVDINEVNQACRPYSNIRIIDYDTFCSMYIGARPETSVA